MFENAIRRQLGTGWNFASQIFGAFLTMILVCVCLLFGINEWREFQNNRDTTYFLNLKTLTINIASYDDEKLVLNQIVAKEVRIPLNVSVRREFYCLTPPYPIYKTQVSEFFSVDRFRSEFITETNDYRLVEQNEVSSKVEIPVNELVKSCLSIYEVAYYSVRMPDGRLRENAFILTSLPIPLPNENPNLIIPKGAGSVNFGEDSRHQQFPNSPPNRVEKTETSTEIVRERETVKESPAPQNQPVNDVVKEITKPVTKEVDNVVKEVDDIRSGLGL